MNKIKKMKKRTMAAFAVVFFLGLAGYVSAQIIPPPPEGDDMFDSVAHIILDFTSTLGFSMEVDVVGPTRIHRFSPSPQRIIQTEMRSLNLAGGGTDANGNFNDVSVSLRTDRRSDGQIDANTGFSYFNVWPRFRVSQSGEEVGVFQTATAVRLQATIRAIPPIEIAYIPPSPEPVRLVDLNGNPVGLLVHVQHVPAQPSNAKIKRELIAIEKKLDRIINALGVPNSKTAAPVVKPGGKPKEKAESQTSAPAESNDGKALAKNK